jgi:hypothetical protein
VIGPEHEGARAEAAGPAFTDAVTFAFGDEAAGLYGLARLGLSDGGRAGSALAVLFAGTEPVAALARGGVELPAAGDWGGLAVDGLAASVDEPLRRWTVRLEGERGFELAFEALGPPAELAAGEPAARAGGMAGYEQLCRVTGTVRAGGAARELHCRGQRGHAWGEPDWGRMDSVRALGAWMPDGSGLVMTAVRPAGARHHASDSKWAALLDPAGALVVFEPRLSTTYDGEGRQRRAGLELWVGEEDGHPRQAAGEVLCGSTVELGELRLDCAFFRWHMEGSTGVGHYDVLRRA